MTLLLVDHPASCNGRARVVLHPSTITWRRFLWVAAASFSSGVVDRGGDAGQAARRWTTGLAWTRWLRHLPCPDESAVLRGHPVRRRVRGQKTVTLQREDLEDGSLFTNEPEAVFTGCLLLFLATMTPGDPEPAPGPAVGGD